MINLARILFLFIKRFFTKTIWDADYRKLGFLRRLLYSSFRIAILAVRGFIDDRCTLQSSALTYITLVSIVPTLAITLSFCKGIGLQRRLLNSLGLQPIITQVVDSEGQRRIEITYEIVTAETIEHAKKSSVQEGGLPMPPGALGAPKTPTRPGVAAQLPKPMQTALVNVFTYVDKTNFAAIGFIGLAALLATVIASIKKLENIFNKIWCIQRGRPLGRQICEYLVVLLFIPIVLLCALSIQGLISSGELYEMMHTTSPFVQKLGNMSAHLLMVLFVVCAFAFLYIFMPNTRVKGGPAFVGGLVASICFAAVLCAYIKWQIGLAKYNAIYGTFAALPFFLAWLYANWTVILLGAEISYAAQNHRLLRQTKATHALEPGACHLLGIVIMNEICTRFADGKGPWNAGDFAAEHNIPITELETALEALRNAKLLLQINPLATPPACYDYLPGRPPQQLTLHDVAEAYTRLDSEQAKRIGRHLPEELRQKLIDHHKRTVAALDDLNFQPVKTASEECPAQ